MTDGELARVRNQIERALENLPTRPLYESYGETGWDADDNALVDDALRGALKAIAALEAERDERLTAEEVDARDKVIAAAAYERGLEDAAKVAEKSREHWRSASPQTEPWTPEQMTMRLTEADYLAAAIRKLKPRDNELKQGVADTPAKPE